MSNSKTITLLNKLIILENLFLINRSYLINKQMLWFFCNSIFVTITSVFASVIINDVFLSEENVGSGLRFLEIISVIEIIQLSSAARSSKSFSAIEKLDEKCSDDKDYSSNFKEIVFNEIFIFVLTTIFDLAGVAIIDIKTSVLLPVFIASLAKDAEIMFYSLLIKGINLRLSILDKVPPSLGAKRYGYILIATDSLCESYSIRILFMLSTILFKTVMYLSLFVLNGYPLSPVSAYLTFRLSKSLYSVWILCRAAAESETICKRLAFNLASKLILDPKINGHSKSTKYVTRWLSKINLRRPIYISGSVMTIDRTILLNMLDLGISYMLIVVQIYVAFVL